MRILKASEAFQVRGTGPETSRTFAIGDEDHTLGNALRHVLIHNSKVGFAGYSVPHPSEPVVHIRVQANAPTTAMQALREACETLHKQCSIVLEKLEEKLPEIKDDKQQFEEKVEERLRDEAMAEEAEDEVMED